MRTHPHARGRQHSLEDLIAFHGHLGGFAVLGYQAGRLLLEALAAESHFGLALVAWCPAQPPWSCLVDGLQLSTGCTPGKGNLHLRPSTDLRLRAVNLHTGRRAELTPCPEALDHLLRLTREEGPEAAGRWAWDQAPSDLWRVRD